MGDIKGLIDSLGSLFKDKLVKKNGNLVIVILKNNFSSPFGTNTVVIPDVFQENSRVTQ